MTTTSTSQANASVIGDKWETCPNKTCSQRFSVVVYILLLASNNLLNQRQNPFCQVVMGTFDLQRTHSMCRNCVSWGHYIVHIIIIPTGLCLKKHTTYQLFWYFDSSEALKLQWTSALRMHSNIGIRPKARLDCWLVGYSYFVVACFCFRCFSVLVSSFSFKVNKHPITNQH